MMSFRRRLQFTITFIKAHEETATEASYGHTEITWDFENPDETTTVRCHIESSSLLEITSREVQGRVVGMYSCWINWEDAPTEWRTSQQSTLRWRARDVIDTRHNETVLAGPFDVETINIEGNERNHMRLTLRLVS